MMHCLVESGVLEARADRSSDAQVFAAARLDVLQLQ